MGAAAVEAPRTTNADEGAFEAAEEGAPDLGGLVNAVMGGCGEAYYGTAGVRWLPDMDLNAAGVGGVF